MKADESLKYLHDIRGSINVVSGFLRCIEDYELNKDHRELHQAAKISLEKIQVKLESLNSLLKTNRSSQND